MNKTILRVFLIIAILLGVLVFWNLTFSDGGIVETAWNTLISPVNNTWQAVTGTSSNLLPELEITDTATFDGDGGTSDGTGPGSQ